MVNEHCLQLWTDTMNAEGVVHTVEGPISPADVGVTSIHEHLSVDMSYCAMPPRNDRQRRYADQPIALEFLGDVRRDPVVFGDALRLKDVGLVAGELQQFAELGGCTVVDVTTRGLDPDPLAVRAIARTAGVNVVMGCGHYLAGSHPPEVASSCAEDLAWNLVHEIRNGFDATDIRPGVIGEIGTGDPVHPEEWKTLDAACLAQLATGLPIFVHVDPAGDAPTVVERMMARGVAPDRINVCHMDCRTDLDYLRRVASYGVYMSLDTFGMEVHYDSFDYASSLHDSQRIRTLVDLVNLGLDHQLVIGQDVCMKIQLTKFGGYGYGHLLRHIVPNLRFLGVEDSTIDRMLVTNPRQLLAVPADAGA